MKKESEKKIKRIKKSIWDKRQKIKNPGYLVYKNI